MEEDIRKIHDAVRAANKNTGFFHNGVLFYFPDSMTHVTIEYKGKPKIDKKNVVLEFDFKSNVNPEFQFDRQHPLDEPIVLEVKYSQDDLGDRHPDELVLQIKYDDGWIDKTVVDKITYPPGGKWIGAHRVLIERFDDPMVAWGP
ncbi:MAG: hypothetical protein MUO58_01015 [Anaerolineales bacterium]|nr:hypothetical protein [Anaerolineales bacterium]